MPEAIMVTSVKIGLPASRAARAAATAPGEKTMSSARSVWPAAWIMRTATTSSSGEKRPRSDSARMTENDSR